MLFFTRTPLRLFILTCLSIAVLSVNARDNKYIQRADQTLTCIRQFYLSKQKFLLNENFPNEAGEAVTYLASKDSSVRSKVAYLWPTSGVFSGVNALLKTTKNNRYATLLNDSIIPGIELYFDNSRTPFCYQSYLAVAGKSDRYYDDNVWLGIDFLESFHRTGNRQFLEKSLQTWQFIISGWSEELGGGIYWCEQKKGSKNTCSNAPAAVLAFQLFETTGDSLYFRWGQKIYDWTKTNLQDPEDLLYFDNKSLSGKISKTKYAYNSGQMLQAAALLYKLTGKEPYLDEARKMAKSAIQYFTEDFVTPESKQIRLFRNWGNWFVAILLRGYTELYALDNNKEYLQIFRDNLDHVWENARYDKGLFIKDWSGKGDGSKRKWLLDQAAMVEMYAVLGRYSDQP